MSVTASIVIRTKNEAKTLPRVLGLIMEQALAPLDIVVVDSGSTDGTVEIVGRRKDITLVQVPPDSFTYGGSLNAGFEAAQGEVVACLSAHAFPCSGNWLRHLVRHFDDPRVAGVYGKQLCQPDAWPIVRRDHLRYWGDQRQVQTKAGGYPDHSFSNANSAVRRRCWKTAPFDEQLTYCEDREWARRLLNDGYHIVYEPAAAVHHSHNEGLIKASRRAHQEAVSMRSLYGRQTTLKGACDSYVRAVSGDMRFVLQNGEGWRWLLWSPVYRFFLTLARLGPELPDALWEPMRRRWKARGRSV